MQVGGRPKICGVCAGDCHPSDSNLFHHLHLGRGASACWVKQFGAARESDYLYIRCIDSVTVLVIAVIQ